MTPINPFEHEVLRAQNKRLRAEGQRPSETERLPSPEFVWWKIERYARSHASENRFDRETRRQDLAATMHELFRAVGLMPP